MQIYTLRFGQILVQRKPLNGIISGKRQRDSNNPLIIINEFTTLGVKG